MNQQEHKGAKMKSHSRISRIILRERKKKRLSLAALSKETGFSYVYLWKIQNEELIPTWDRALKILETLGVKSIEL